MLKASKITKILLGLIYFVFGLNGFFHFIPMKSPSLSYHALSFVSGLMKAGYFMPQLSGVQTICGLLLLTGYAAPLGLVILAPVTINIFLFHAFMTPGIGNQILPLVLVILHVISATGYWPLYRPLFAKR
jgi:hypothetical protein